MLQLSQGRRGVAISGARRVVTACASQFESASQSDACQRVGTRFFHHRCWQAAGKKLTQTWMECQLVYTYFRSRFCRWCHSTCPATWTCRLVNAVETMASKATQDELSEDESSSFGQQSQSRPGGCNGWRLCLSWLPCTLYNSKLSWYLLKYYNNCILPIFLYGSWLTRDLLKVDDLNQWCLLKLLGIKW